MNAILVLNSGSSSIKFAVFGISDADNGLALLAEGAIAQAGSDTDFVVKRANGTVLEKSRCHTQGAQFNHDHALRELLSWLQAYSDGVTLLAIGHRVVHGGEVYAGPIRITPRVLDELRQLVPLAPLHQPHNLRAIELLADRLPNVPQIACFDTAFHRTQPWVAQSFALPREMTAAGIRRYGFHGLSYEYIVTQLPQHLGSKAQSRVIVAHLGNGASLCAMREGKSIASTMGFTALDGLMMGTRCGTLDPGVVLYLLRQRRMSPDEVTDCLYNCSGLLGVSGISGDMRVLLASADFRAIEAIDLFAYRVVREIGSLVAALGGLDALIFTGGIGEHAWQIRERVCDASSWLGIELDKDANRSGQTTISAALSRVVVSVIPTDEESMIAMHTLRCFQHAPSSSFDQQRRKDIP